MDDVLTQIPSVGVFLGYAMGIITGLLIASIRRRKEPQSVIGSWRHLAMLAADECIRLREKYEPAPTPPAE